jgi:hypothetical protein
VEEKMKKIALILFILSIVMTIIPCRAIGAGGDEALFTSTQADALLVLDLSGSMRMLPAGDYMYLPDGTPCGDPCRSDNVSTVTNPPFYTQSGGTHSKKVRIISVSSTDNDTDPISTVPKYGDETCSDHFYRKSQPGYTTNCRKTVIAQRGIFDLLDADKSGFVEADNRDYNSLCIKMGYMRFYKCQKSYNEGSNYSGPWNEDTNCNTLIYPVPTSYSTIYSKVKTEFGNGTTALVGSLREAKLYLDTLPKNERKRFVILVTDGADSLSCCAGYDGVLGQDCKEGHRIDYKKNRSSVAAAKALWDAGYTLIVVGFGGDLPFMWKNTLNWMAYYGGGGADNNPDAPNSGSIPPDPNAYKPDDVASNLCQTSPPEKCYVYSDLLKSVYTPCDIPTPIINENLLCPGDPKCCYCFASSNDPAADAATLSGYAFMAENATQFSNALTAIAKLINGAGAYYDFTSPTVSPVRSVDQNQNLIYLSSFTPKANTPFWEGSLKDYRLEADGTLKVGANGLPVNAPIWVTSIPIPGSRSIWTYIYNTPDEFVEFTQAKIKKDDLGVGTSAERNEIVSYIRSLKLGDIFHSNPVIVAAPSPFFNDTGYSGVGGFYENNKGRKRVVIAGANDGMLHAFNGGDWDVVNNKYTDGTGVELWAFIPNSLLKRLKLLVPTVPDYSSQHNYYVDLTPKVADVWFDDNADNKKTANEWRTVLVCGLRKGGKSYFALDITDTLNPKYLWEFPNPNDPNYLTILAKLGQSWSEPAIDRVRVGGHEKWVAFIGGGFPAPDNGMVFYVVDMKTGIPIKEFSGLGGMDYSLAAPPTAVDTNLDGYIDKVYIGDLKGQMWVFDVSNSDTINWTGKRLFQAPDTHPIYYPPAVAFDKFKTPWVYFGTGDRENPGAIVANVNLNERFYAVKDDGDGSYPRGEGDLSDVTTNPPTFTPNPAKKGWYIKFINPPLSSEKVLAKPTVFNQLVYFTTFTPAAGDPCSIGSGSANLYIAESLSGGGALTVDDLSDLSGAPSQRSEQIGTGVPSAPVISVDLNGKASLTIVTTNNQALSQKAFFTTNKAILYWREVVH